MQYDQTLKRLLECGLTIEDAREIPPDFYCQLVFGQLAMVVVNKGCPCKDCEKRHLWVKFVEPKDLPSPLRSLLTGSTARRTKNK